MKRRAKKQRDNEPRSDEGQAQERFRAGCGREREGPGDLEDLAYTELAFAECPTCPHRLAPEDGPAFCRWLRTDAAHPFAVLAHWLPEQAQDEG